MVEEKPVQKTEGIPEKKPEEEKEEKELLARSEIKTMNKDVSILREAQAKQERDKIAEIRTGEERQEEKEKQARAQKAAAERAVAEKEAKAKEEEFKRLREEREQKESTLGKEEIEKQEVRAEGFKGILRETQAKEEEERKRFLKRVEAKAEGKEAPAAPLATPPLPLSAEPPEKPGEKPEKLKPLQILKKIPKPAFGKSFLKKIPEPTFRRPSFTQKLWIRIVLTLLVLALIGIVVTFWYWYLVARKAPVVEEEVIEEEIVEEVEETLFIPPALITTEASQILEISLFEQFLKEELAENQFTRLIIKDTQENKVLGLKEFFAALAVETPTTFYDKVNNDFTLFIYSSQETNRLGFIAEIKEADLLYLLKYWEETMEADFENFSVLLGKTSPALVSSFKESTYKDTAFRYLSFPQENFGICWAMVDNYFIFTFSGESMIKTIDKINE